MTILLARILARLVPPRIDGRELWKNLYKMGVKSLPDRGRDPRLFTGAIMVIQAAPLVKRLRRARPPRLGRRLRNAARDRRRCSLR